MFGINSDWPELGRKSISTDVIHKNPQQYIAELLMVNENEALRNIPYFWRNRIYAARYLNRLVQAKNHIDSAGFKAVHNAVLKHKLGNLDDKAVDRIAEEILAG